MVKVHSAPKVDRSYLSDGKKLVTVSVVLFLRKRLKKSHSIEKSEAFPLILYA